MTATLHLSCSLRLQPLMMLQYTDLVTLTIDSNKEQEVCDAIVGALNAANAHSSGMVVVADALAGVFISPFISGTALTLDT